jgi:hypothetical protein
VYCFEFNLDLPQQQLLWLSSPHHPNPTHTPQHSLQFKILPLLLLLLSLPLLLLLQAHRE